MTRKKLKNSIRPGKVLFAFNPHCNKNLEVDIYRIVSKPDSAGRYTIQVDGVYGIYHTHRYISDDLRYPKFIGLSRAAAMRAAKRYISDPDAMANVENHAFECNLMNDLVNQLNITPYIWYK